MNQDPPEEVKQPNDMDKSVIDDIPVIDDDESLLPSDSEGISDPSFLHSSAFEETGKDMISEEGKSGVSQYHDAQEPPEMKETTKEGIEVEHEEIKMEEPAEQMKDSLASIRQDSEPEPIEPVKKESVAIPAKEVEQSVQPEPEPVVE